MRYIATCFSHFGAMRLQKILTTEGVSARLMPVPRALSSSCGTCVSFIDDRADADYTSYEDKYDEIEQIVVVLEDGGYKKIYGD